MEADDSSLRVLSLAQQHAFSFLNNLDRAPVGATLDLTTLRQRLNKPLADAGLSPEQVITELVDDVEGGLLGSAGGRFFGWVIGGSLPAALAADWLTATWDQNAALYATSPAAAVVEEVAGLWLKDILGLPAHASLALVSGCQMAHATCLAAARHALLAERGWDVEERGLYGAPRDINYTDVTKVKGQGLSKGAKFGILTGVLARAVIIGALISFKNFDPFENGVLR